MLWDATANNHLWSNFKTAGIPIRILISCNRWLQSLSRKCHDVSFTLYKNNQLLQLVRFVPKIVAFKIRRILEEILNFHLVQTHHCTFYFKNICYRPNNPGMSQLWPLSSVITQFLSSRCMPIIFFWERFLSFISICLTES